MPENEGLLQFDRKGIEEGKLKLELMVGWQEGKVAYYTVYYLNDKGDFTKYLNAPDHLKG